MSSNKGFFDKVRGMVSPFGDETVRVVDYDEEEDEVEAPPEKPRQHRGQKAKRTKIVKPKPAAAPTPKPAPKPSPKLIPEPEPRPVAAPIAAQNFVEYNTSAFDLGDAQFDDFLMESQKKYDKRFDGVPDLSPKDDKIQDVLEFAEIPASFAIAKGVFLPDDLESVFFELQRPQGYDVGQVNHFLKDTKTTVEHYVMLLERRNEHVAQLASIIDRLQVSMMNEKLANEAAEGISIMPTSDSDNIEALLLELKLENRRLKDQICDLSKGDQLSSRERGLHESLKDELGVVRREKEQLEEELNTLQTRLAQMDEDEGDELPVHTIEEPNLGVDDGEYEIAEDAFNLPEIAVDDFDIETEEVPSTEVLYGQKSAFSPPDQSGESYIELLGGEGFATQDGERFLQDDDSLEDDDAFDKMITDWEYND